MANVYCRGWGEDEGEQGISLSWPRPGEAAPASLGQGRPLRPQCTKRRKDRQKDGESRADNAERQGGEEGGWRDTD